MNKKILNASSIILLSFLIISITCFISNYKDIRYITAFTFAAYDILIPTIIALTFAIFTCIWIFAYKQEKLKIVISVIFLVIILITTIIAWSSSIDFISRTLTRWKDYQERINIYDIIFVLASYFSCILASLISLYLVFYMLIKSKAIKSISSLILNKVSNYKETRKAKKLLKAKQVIEELEKKDNLK